MQSRFSPKFRFSRSTSLLLAVSAQALTFGYVGCGGGSGDSTNGGSTSTGGTSGGETATGGNAVGGSSTGGNAVGGSSTGGNTVGGSGGVAEMGGAGAGGTTGGTDSGGSGGNSTGGSSPVGMGPACATTAGVQDGGLNLTVNDPTIGTRSLGAAPNGNMMRIRHDPLNDRLIVMSQSGQFWEVNTTIGGTTPLNLHEPQTNNCRSMAFAADGTLYVQCHGGGGISVNIQKGTPDGNKGYTWTTLVTSEGYPPPSPTGSNFDHSFNGLAVSPDGSKLYFGSGSRSDHGEVEAGNREMPLTSAVFEVPTDGATPIMIANSDQGVMPYLFADGTRNPFDIAFNADGALFGVDNGPDMDLPDEINFLEKGKHYGFPWRFGDVDNPVRDPSYTAANDMRLHGGYQAVDNNLYVADPNFPAPPPVMVDPIPNHGPDSDHFRVGKDGAPQEVSTTAMPGATAMAGITPHKSPAGLNFDVAGTLCGKFNKAGFFVSYGAVGDFFADAGRDLSMITLIKVANGYEMNVEQLVAGFGAATIDAVLVGNKIYVVEYQGNPQIIEITLPSPA